MKKRKDRRVEKLRSYGCMPGQSGREEKTMKNLQTSDPSDEQHGQLQEGSKLINYQVYVENKMRKQPHIVFANTSALAQVNTMR